jgi:osmotically-inducible protein OsmY
MMDDSALRRKIEDELEFVPCGDAAHIEVAVSNGVVTLTGDVENLAQKIAAEKAAQAVKGVSAVADEIEVHPYRIKAVDMLNPERASRNGICGEVAAALKRTPDIDATGIMIVAHSDRVALLGKVSSSQQRDAAERAALSAPGVVAIENRLEIE